jgi:hypothetical protein
LSWRYDRYQRSLILDVWDERSFCTLVHGKLSLLIVAYQCCDLVDTGLKYHSSIYKEFRSSKGEVGGP